jgi:hypothetical protein
MTSIDLVSLMTLIYVLVDDWYQSKGHGLLKGKAGMKPEFSDSEMLTLMVMQDFIPYPGETQYIAYIRANHIREFPKVVDQSQYNRRARNLGWVAGSPAARLAEPVGGNPGAPIAAGYETGAGGGLHPLQAAQFLSGTRRLWLLCRPSNALLWLQTG